MARAAHEEIVPVAPVELVIPWPRPPSRSLASQEVVISRLAKQVIGPPAPFRAFGALVP